MASVSAVNPPTATGITTNSYSYTTTSPSTNMAVNSLPGQVYQSAPPQQVYLNANTSNAAQNVISDVISAASNLIKNSAPGVTTTTAPPTYSSTTYQASSAAPVVMLERPGMNAPGFNHSTQMNVNMIDEAALYRPQNAELLLPGRQLRGGMRPVYDPTLVRTFEAFPVFHAAVAGDAGIYQSVAVGGGAKVTHRGVGLSEPSVAGSVKDKSVGGSVSVQQELKKRNYVCC